MVALATARDFAAPHDQPLLVAGLGAFVLDRLDNYHNRWNERVGGFAVALGLGEPGTEPTAEAALAPWEQNFAYAYRDLAFDNAVANLIAAAQRGSKLTPAYAGELVGIGWRECWLACVTAIAHSDPHFFVGLTRAPSVIPAPVAAQARAQRLVTLAGASGLSALGERVDAKLLYKCWKTYSSLGKGGGAVDAVELLLALLGKGNSGRSWLAAQVAAVNGRVCADCGCVLDEVTAAALRRVTDRRTGRGAEKPEDFVLACRSCARQHRPRATGPTFEAVVPTVPSPAGAAV
jgi:hypothetical protein